MRKRENSLCKCTGYFFEYLIDVQYNMEKYRNQVVYDENTVYVCYTDSNSVGTISIRIMEGV